MTHQTLNVATPGSGTPQASAAKRRHLLNSYIHGGDVSDHKRAGLFNRSFASPNCNTWSTEIPGLPAGAAAALVKPRMCSATCRHKPISGFQTTM